MARQHPSRDKEPALTVPLVDAYAGRSFYAPRLVRFALAGALGGAALFAILGYALADGTLPWPALGQWAAAGRGPATFAGAGLGAAIGGLVGALLALGRLSS